MSELFASNVAAVVKADGAHDFGADFGWPFLTLAFSMIKVEAGEFDFKLERAIFEHRHDTTDKFAVEFAGGVVELGDELSWFTPLASRTGPSGGAGVVCPPGAISLN